MINSDAGSTAVFEKGIGIPRQSLRVMMMPLVVRVPARYAAVNAAKSSATLRAVVDNP